MKLERNHLLQVLIDILLINLCWFGALVLRFDGRIPGNYLDHWLIIVITMTVVRIGFFIFFRLYRSLWSYSSVPEFFLVLKAVTVSTIVIWAFALTAQELNWLPFPTPKAIGIIDWLLCILSLGGLRFAIRLRREWVISRRNTNNSPQKKLLIVGAGEAGSLIIREISKQLSSNYFPIGFIDDDPCKQGHHMHGIPVLGTREDIPRIIKQYEVEEVIIALPSASKKDIREILEICHQEVAHVLIVPAVAEIINGTVTMKQLRDVAIEDLLGREPVSVDLTSIAGYLTGERVLITGAGGSIGSELCRQLAPFKPTQLLLLGRGENSIYEIDQELTVDFPELNKVPIIADIRDREKLTQVFRDYRPTVIFHAAAHKHVPLMELEPDEAVKNNVFGTKNMAELADQFKCKRFVLISTDKAVNPSSVMGATKRVAELIIQDLNTRSQTKFMAVRFGNVLGSRGSVIPLFRRQIARGGPITVTHPEMTRFFMTIPEAAQLVIQAGALGHGGEVFILDMGDPVKIVDLARDLIRLSGFVPDKDIKIEFKGIRPGEKMYEELLTRDEGVRATKHERIFTTQVKQVDRNVLAERLEILHDHLGDNLLVVRTQLKRLVAEYNQWTGGEKQDVVGSHGS
ncbi:MAG TPA: nucleoside-diphosphate sugar epimerase/dehydratase [Bacillota bacterium]